ncbi:MAG: uroporphyrinogen decarboxylase family protein [Sedimentisphaeraceae bacterium JB056]
MEKREVVIEALEGKEVEYTPWSFSFTQEPLTELKKHYNTDDIESVLGNHLLSLGNPCGCFENIGNDHFRDIFGVVWDRTTDKDIGVVSGCVLPEPTTKDLVLPDPCDEAFHKGVKERIESNSDMFRVYPIGFSLFERAWTLRGMENLMMDFVVNPDFVDDLLTKIADFNLALVDEVLKYDIDAVYFGDDWGQQSGLMMGPALWRRFIYPQIKRMYGRVKDAGKYVFIHSCGDVDELFDDLIAAGLDCFNPFQPEVMDVENIYQEYKGRLAFHGGLSTQKTLPFGTKEDVRAESGKLLEMGLDGGYIFAPAHAVESDVSFENILAFIDTAKSQKGYVES